MIHEQSSTVASGDLHAVGLVRRFRRLAKLSPVELELAQAAGSAGATTFPPRAFIQLAAEKTPAARYIIQGWAAHIREMEDGRRQMYHILLPGDSIAGQLNVCVADQAVQAITLVRTVPAKRLHSAAVDQANHPGICSAVAIATAQQHCFLLNQIVRLGQQSAYERMAHLFAELHFRCEENGLLEGDTIPFPLTQDAIGDLLGLSVVHVNRTLQILRRENVVSLKQGRLTFLDLTALLKASEFKPPGTTSG